PLGSKAQGAWQGPAGLLLLGARLFPTWAPWAQVGVACAGTATEQLVGIGCAVLSLAGPGPQFTLGFAKRQSRLLGGAVRVCRKGPELQRALELLLKSPDLQLELGRIGRQRMGPPGGSAAIATLIKERLLTNCDVQISNRNANDPALKTPECT
ncbi:MAG: sugar synthetase, partial [Synechococcus sp. SupBloom_Metag_053]|nr:sugar synthetase [Synechococcus sp. SupBloom_Metag_053]